MYLVTRILFMAGYQAFWLATGAVVGGIFERNEKENASTDDVYEEEEFADPTSPSL